MDKETINTWGRWGGVVIAMSALALAGCNSSSDDGGGINTASESRSISEDVWHEYETEVPADTTKLTVRLHELGGDADLWVIGPGGAPSCGSFNAGTQPDECEFDDPREGSWTIEVEGWDPGTYNYRLTVTLEPSDREATLEFVDEGSWAPAAATLAASQDRHDRAADQLSLLTAIAELSIGQNGEADYYFKQDDQLMGQLQMNVTQHQGQREVSFKLVAEAHAGERLVMSTLPGQPMVFDGMATQAAQGVLAFRSNDGRAELSLGQDTATAADIRVLAEPGPVFSEQSWMQDDTQLEFIRH
ncbi:PPC domain-containing protein [Natronospira bacteriovora]|uniref:PPC domain-containing protein n=1 Tax=Natronospira bacteriovora TaxID=3069753 RepID=A0ABU0WD81_9GAMM|nr:PPC domain-containing protein [Natronospira sp. AB-CW4]MDQ2070875.1 PPC domain-containing protein [Natronospira sp. AB-CW4]